MIIVDSIKVLHTSPSSPPGKNECGDLYLKITKLINISIVSGYLFIKEREVRLDQTQYNSHRTNNHLKPYISYAMFEDLAKGK